MSKKAEPAERLAQRADLWVWHARFVKRRSDAAEMIRKGHVRLNGQRITDPGHRIKLGVVLTLALSGRTMLVEVLDFSDRRGGAEDAAGLYRSLEQGASQP